MHERASADWFTKKPTLKCVECKQVHLFDCKYSSGSYSKTISGNDTFYGYSTICRICQPFNFEDYMKQFTSRLAFKN